MREKVEKGEGGREGGRQGEREEEREGGKEEGGVHNAGLEVSKGRYNSLLSCDTFRKRV